MQRQFIKDYDLSFYGFFFKMGCSMGIEAGLVLNSVVFDMAEGVEF